MIKDIKEGFKLLKYAGSKKTMTVTTILFFIMGVLYTVFVEVEGLFHFGAFFVMGLPMFVIQLTQTLLGSEMVVSSDLNYKLNTSIPSYIHLVLSIITYAFLGILVFIRNISSLNYIPMERLDSLFIVGGVFSLILAVYLGVCYKYYYQSMVPFVFVVLLFSYLMYFKGYIDVLCKFNLITSILIGLGLIIIGFILQLTFSKLCYKKPIVRKSIESFMK